MLTHSPSRPSADDPLGEDAYVTARCDHGGCHKALGLKIPAYLCRTSEEQHRYATERMLSELRSEGWMSYDEGMVACPEHRPDLYLHPLRQQMLQATGEARSGFQAQLDREVQQWSRRDDASSLYAMRLIERCLPTLPLTQPPVSSDPNQFMYSPKDWGTLDYQQPPPTTLPNPASSALAGMVAQPEMVPPPAKKIDRVPAQGMARPSLPDSFISADPFPGYRPIKESIPA